MSHHHDSENDVLPEPLPPGERLLWQGQPDWKSLAIRAFHVRMIAVYFSVILVTRGLTAWSSGAPVTDALMSMVWLLPLVVGALAMLCLMAYLCARTARYAITDRRVILRIGVVLDITFNLPFSSIASADLVGPSRTCGDIALHLVAPNKIAYVHLWPHARPWRVARPEPMMRALVNAKEVGQILAQALNAQAEAANTAHMDEAASAVVSLPMSSQPRAVHTVAAARAMSLTS